MEKKYVCGGCGSSAEFDDGESSRCIIADCPDKIDIPAEFLRGSCWNCILTACQLQIKSVVIDGN